MWYKIAVACLPPSESLRISLVALPIWKYTKRDLVVQPIQVDTLQSRCAIPLIPVAVGRPHHVGRSLRMLERPCIMATGCPQSEGSRERTGESCNLLYGLVLEVTSHPFCHILFIPGGSLSPEHPQRVIRLHILLRGVSKNCGHILKGSNSKSQSQVLWAEVATKGLEELDECKTLPKAQCGQRLVGKPWGRAA